MSHTINALRPTTLQIDVRQGIPRLTVRHRGVQLTRRAEQEVVSSLREQHPAATEIVSRCRVTVDVCWSNCEPDAATIASWIAEGLAGRAPEVRFTNASIDNADRPIVHCDQY